jgi:hypothetical protein
MQFRWEDRRCMQTLVGKPLGKQLLGRWRLKYNIKMDLRMIDHEYKKWMELT